MVMGFKNNWRDGDMRDVEIYINTIQYVMLNIKPELNDCIYFKHFVSPV